MSNSRRNRKKNSNNRRNQMTQNQNQNQSQGLKQKPKPIPQTEVWRSPERPAEVGRRHTTSKSGASKRLRFSPTAWAKLLFLRDIGDTEVGGFGITPADDLLFVED